VDATPREIRIFETVDDRQPFSDWMDSLDGQPIYEKIMVKLDKVERGNLGDARSVGEGVSELEIDFGEGYRVYFGQIGKRGEIVVLLCGGTKKTQSEDIGVAKRYWGEFSNAKK
jgi:putative addiction module killer protein